MYKTQSDVRNAFWNTFFVESKPHKFYGKRQNDLPPDVRCAFVDFVDYLAREGTITESLASRVTL